MATWNDISRLALALPEAEEGTTSGGRNRAWTVRKKLFVWERPLRKGDLAALGVLIRLPDIELDLLEEVVTEAWLTRAPKRLVRDFLAGLEDAERRNA